MDPAGLDRHRAFFLGMGTLVAVVETSGPFVDPGPWDGLAALLVASPIFIGLWGASRREQGAFFLNCGLVAGIAWLGLSLFG